MSLILLVAVALAGGAYIGRWWLLLLPPALGAAVALGLAALGHSLGDTPIGFVVVVSTAAVGIGVLLRLSLVPRLA